MPKILSTSAEAAAYGFANERKKLLRRDGSHVFVSNGIVFVGQRLEGYAEYEGQGFSAEYAPFTIPDEPGNEELPEEVVKAIKESNERQYSWVSGQVHIHQALWRATQKAIREQVKP